MDMTGRFLDGIVYKGKKKWALYLIGPNGKEELGYFETYEKALRYAKDIELTFGPAI